ncbi:hypothetical protein QMK19_22040 [Streptomyces sp. H10-C2]|uniref:hypothetical protein n=1 Tax=unclassified Streptomyces TaxID=2593676 RepID=UPI0024B983B7|nr:MULTISPECIES: hypothetical protein [unclassified Streptomyces]MDJ0342416.1 hypothetical protein [Streptomyces sp. PH10-H1]MDJ0372271.1 hypothetical protein [Streptomyces sp. H10-C2]
MSTPARPVAADGLLLPAERGRRAVGDLGVVLGVMAFLLMLEVVSFFAGGVLIAGRGMEWSMGAPGVGGYVGLPVIGGVLTLPLLIRSWGQPALRIDAAGISRVQRHRVVTVPWATLDAVQFSQKRGALVLRMRADAAFPGKSRVPNQLVSVPFYALGNTLQHRRRREHHNLIVAAVEHFAPDTYTDEPFRPGDRKAAAQRTP